MYIIHPVYRVWYLLRNIVTLILYLSLRQIRDLREPPETVLTLTFCLVKPHSGGPVIDMKYGRKDATTPQCCVDEGNLPAGNAPFPDADTPQVCRGRK